MTQTELRQDNEVYFKPIKKEYTLSNQLALPDINVLLSKQMSSLSIEVANNKVSEQMANLSELSSESVISPSQSKWMSQKP